MNDEHAVAWLARKIGWGPGLGQLDEWRAAGPNTILDRLVDPDAHGVPERPDPFASIEFDPERVGRSVRQGVASWMQHAVQSPRPLETFMEFFWSDFFAVSIRSVRPPTLMFDHMNLLGRHGLGNFGELLHDVTIDAAMLRFLDGATNTEESPNENYGRELLELYSVGVGNFTEDDVKAAARALTGWVVRRIDPVPRFRSNRHDDTPQTLLGVDGVHDVETTIEAVLAHPATATRVAGKIATAILGPGHDAGTYGAAVERFGGDWELRPLVGALLELAVDGAAQPALVEPFPWFVGAIRLTGAPTENRRVQEYFRTAGQTPLLPPNVGGFPEPAAYLSTSATIARFNMASHLAERAASRSPLTDLAGDLDGLASTLGVVDGFAPSTRSALDRLTDPVDRLAAALASPDLVVI